MSSVGLRNTSMKFGEIPDGDYRACTIDDCHGVHRARGMCKRHYQAWYKKGDPRSFRFINSSGLCTLDGCEKPCRSAGSIYCDMHYMRLRRSGSLDGMMRNAARGVWESSTGYLVESAPGHPLNKNKHGVYLHRRVFYDENGEGPFRCNWCSKWVTWKNMHVDHKDENRRNNDIANLAPACRRCNQHRSGEAARKTALSKSPMLSLGSVTKTQAQWARELGITSASLIWRINVAKWPMDRALTETRGATGPRRVSQTTMFDALFDISKTHAEAVKRGAREY